MAAEFVRVRLIRITGADLSLFDFDCDLTWAAFLMNADEKIYGRYGGRDAASADSRISLAGLRYAMKAALAAHRADQGGTARKAGKSVLAEAYAAAKNHKGCVHCHQVNEFRRAELKATGQWDRGMLWVYPLPENVGITLDVDEGNKVRAIQPGTPAATAGLTVGDHLHTLNGSPVASFADVQYALHRAPAAGEVAVTWTRGELAMTGMLKLANGWRKTNLTWRPSMLDILPSLSIYGEDLNAKERQPLGLSAKHVAFRQQTPVHKDAKVAGVREGDVIIGIDGLDLDMTVDQFLGYVRRNYLVGDRVALNLLRDGKRLDVPLTLK